MRLLTHCKRLHFLHLRKAGGTTARRVLERICELNNISFSASEGWPLSHSSIDDDTFLVVNFRDPLERICSLYNAEGRWIHQSKNTSTLPFDQWISGTGPRSDDHHRWPPLWHCTDQYYVRSFCDGPGQTRNKEEISCRNIAGEDYKNAIRNLQRADLVMICEWLNDERHRKYLSCGLVGRGQGLLSMPRHNRTAGRHQYDIRESLTDQDRETVRAANDWDFELYRYARWWAEQAALSIISQE